MHVFHRVPHVDLRLGLVFAEGVEPSQVPAGFDEALRGLLAARAAGLTPALEARRQDVRTLLRHGAYRPTGRGKPASEYLLRGAGEGDFPRINGPVDVCNLVSLEALLPISLWDLDLAGADRFVFRHGHPGEAYVFNSAGQDIALEDLIVGCRLTGGDDVGDPIVNPVKDRLDTKTTPGTRRVAAAVYAPGALEARELEEMLSHFEAWLRRCGENVRAAHGMVSPGEEILLAAW